jgi:hypothetical protein
VETPMVMNMFLIILKIATIYPYVKIKELSLKLFWLKMKRKKVPEKNRIKPVEIQTVPLKENDEDIILSYIKNRQYDKMRIDSRPEGRESKSVNELVEMSRMPANKKIMLPSLMIFLNLRDSINLNKKSEIIEYSTIVNNL